MCDKESSFRYGSAFFGWSNDEFSPDIGALLGGRIHDQLDKEVHAALDGALNMAAGNNFCLISSGCYMAVLSRGGWPQSAQL